MRKSDMRTIILALIFFVYLLIGAAIFSTIETPNEMRFAEEIYNRRKKFLHQHTCVSELSLDNLIKEIMKANNLGISIESNQTRTSMWTFGQSFFFSSIVVTTVGYGHQSPSSPEGKIFCIIYALIGIPMTFLLLSAIVDRLMIPSKKIFEFIVNRIGHLYTPLTLRILHFILMTCFVIVFFILIPSLLFTILEFNWTYMDALYYCFISLTTIGLGDYIPGDVPGQPFKSLYKAALSFYLLMGITCTFLLLNIFYNIPQFDLGVFLSSEKENSPTFDSADPERMRLHQPGAEQPKYLERTSNNPKHENAEIRRTTIVRARSRPGDDDDSP